MPIVLKLRSLRTCRIASKHLILFNSPSRTFRHFPMEQLVTGTFLYFAYGSNLFTQRIHIENPSAVRIGVGKLDGYRLDFNGVSQFWGGSPSTVVPSDGEHVWGALWRLNVVHLKSLDRQEDVPNMYMPFEPNVTMLDGTSVSCRCYMLVNQPAKQDLLPLDRRPSKAYLETILLGALESGLTSDYYESLKRIPDNGNNGPVMPWSKRLYLSNESEL